MSPRSGPGRGELHSPAMRHDGRKVIAQGEERSTEHPGVIQQRLAARLIAVEARFANIQPFDNRCALDAEWREAYKAVQAAGLETVSANAAEPVQLRRATSGS